MAPSITGGALSYHIRNIMKKRIGLLLTLVLSTCLAIFAQEFKAASLWDAQGDIKEIKYSTKDPMMVQKKLKFDKNGKLKNSFIVYNETGYPKALDINMGMINMSVKFVYSPDNKLTDVDLTSVYKGNAHKDISFEYKNGIMTGEKIKSTETGKKPKDWEGTYSFGDYKYDANGNWISRNVTLKVKNLTDGNAEESTYTETRKITYWAN